MTGGAWISVLVAALAAVIVAAVVAAALLMIAARRRRGARPDGILPRAREAFHREREWLEARFLTAASQCGKPRGLIWVECDFEDGVSFARERGSGRLRALVGVTIGFEAVAGGDMEDNPNVANLRAATAVFLYDGQRWTTEGRAVFNLNPAQTIQHYQHELETVD